MFVRIVYMLTKRVDRFYPSTHVREESARYKIEDEDEDDDEDGIDSNTDGR